MCSAKTEDKPLLSAHGLSLELSGKTILRDVSFHLARGETLAIVGPNGAGKSSALKTLLGIYRRRHGELSYRGREVSGFSALELSRVFSYVPQQEERGLDYTVNEFVEMALYSHGLRYGMSTESVTRALSALESTGMTGFSSRIMRTLSGGELQKVYLAGAFAQDSEILLLDEPTSFLDPRYQIEILQTLAHELRAPGAPSAVIIVTHDLNLALSCADRILALQDGAVAFAGSCSEFCDPALVERIYGINLRFGEDEKTHRRFIFPPTLDINMKEQHPGDQS